MNRRSFLTTSGAAVVAASIPDPGTWQTPRAKARFRTGLVAYSYRQALQAKTMTYEDLINADGTPAGTCVTLMIPILDLK